MTLSSFDALSRGLANLRANWRLVPLLWLSQILLMVLTLASVVAFFVPFGISAGLGESLDELRGLSLEAFGMEVAQDLLGIVEEDLVALLLAFGLGLIPATLLGAASMLVSSWFTAGIFAVLLAGERQAPLGAASKAAPDWRSFLTFEWPAFRAWASAGMWPYFWFFNLYLLVGLLAVLLLLLILTVAVWASQAWSPFAGLGIGCVGVPPVVVVLMATFCWYLLGLADLAREALPGEATGVGATSRRALRVLGRRWPAVLLLFAVYLGASVAMSFAMSPVSVFGVRFLGNDLVSYCGVQVVSYLLQTAFLSLLNIPFYGALVALMWNETGRRARVAPWPDLPQAGVEVSR